MAKARKTDKAYDCPIESGAVGPSGVACPQCREGEIVPARGRFGLIWACSGKPRCKFWMRAKPTGKRCAYKRDDGRRCGELMMEGTKTIPDRCSDRECPNHHPHKLAKT